jgi:hypothetical protein
MRAWNMNIGMEVVVRSSGLVAKVVSLDECGDTAKIRYKNGRARWIEASKLDPLPRKEE